MSDAIVRLRIENQEYDAKLKRATEGLQRYVEGCRKAGGTLEVVEKDTLDFVKALGTMETTSKSATGKLNEMKKSFVEWSVIYKEMTAEEKKGDFGKALSKSLDELKVRITEAKTDLADITKELNGTGVAGTDLTSVLQGLGNQFGINSNLMGVVTTGAIGYTAAITAAATATIAATKAWADYNSELSKQTQITTVTTGLKGADADSMTDFAAAVSKIYNVDFRDTINAANTLMNQFGKSSNEAMQLIRDGMQGMISGDGPKMLNMIQQFAPAFRDAGISADQLIAVIHNSEGGLFSDQNMNAILMGIKNIRLMTNSTSEALAKLGIDGEEMTKKMNDGSMTVFEALRKVSDAIEGANASSKEAGEVMQQVFGRQGAMQGMKLGRAIATLNLNLEETKKQTGAVGASMADLESETERLNETIRRAVGYQGWDMMATRIKSEVVGAIASVIGTAESLRETINDITGIDVFSTLISSALDAIGPVGILLDKLRLIAGLGQVGGGDSGHGSGQHPQMQNPLQGVIDKFKQTSTINDQPKKNALQNIEDDSDNATKSIKQLQDELKKLKQLRDDAANTGDVKMRDQYNAQIKDINEQIKALRGGNTTHRTEKKEVELVSGSIAEQTKLVQDLQKAWQNAADDESRKKIKAQIEQAQTDLDEMNGKADAERQKALAAAEAQYANAVKNAPTFESFKTDVTNTMRQKEMKVDETTLKTMMQVAIQNGINDIDVEFSHLWKDIATVNIDDSTWQELQDKINEKLAELHIEPIQIDFKTGNLKTVVKDAKKADDGFKDAMQSVQNLGSALNNLEDPGTKIAGTVGQAIAQIALGFAQATATTGGTSGIFGWIAAITGGLATMTATISAIHSATGYAEGGMVKGPGGVDNVPAWLTAGEIVLNHAQQQNVAQAIMSGNEGGGESGGGIPYVTGETIVLGMNNHLKRSGQGEIVTTGMLKRMKLI